MGRVLDEGLIENPSAPLNDIVTFSVKFSPVNVNVVLALLTLYGNSIVNAFEFTDNTGSVLFFL